MGLADKKRMQVLHFGRNWEHTGCTTCTAWREVRAEIPDAVGAQEMKARNSKDDRECDKRFDLIPGGQQNIERRAQEVAKSGYRKLRKRMSLACAEWHIGEAGKNLPSLVIRRTEQPR